MLHAHARDETRSKLPIPCFLHRARVQSTLFHLGNNARDASPCEDFIQSCRHVANLNTILCFFCRMLFCRMLLIRKNNHWHTNFIKVSLMRDRNIFARHCSFDEAIESNGSLQSRVERRRRVGESGATASRRYHFHQLRQPTLSMLTENLLLSLSPINC